MSSVWGLVLLLPSLFFSSDTMTYDVESANVRQQSVGKEKTDKKKQGYRGNRKQNCRDLCMVTFAGVEKYEIQGKHSAGDDCDARGPDSTRVLLVEERHHE